MCFNKPFWGGFDCYARQNMLLHKHTACPSSDSSDNRPVFVSTRYYLPDERLSGVTAVVSVDNSPSSSSISYETLATYTLCDALTAPPTERVTLTCSTPLLARYVYLYLPSRPLAPNVFLTLCEVQVYGNGKTTIY